MECHSLSYGQIPRTTALFEHFVTDFGRVAGFYGHAPTLDAVFRAAREVQLDPVTRGTVVDVLRRQNRGFGAGDDIHRNIERLAGGAVAVVAGQQVGLFGGPAYTFYKALTAVRIANTLTSRGLDAVPVFWLASEDHDLAEVNHCFWPQGTRRMQRLELAPSVEAVGQSVGGIELGRAVSDLAQQAAEALEGASHEHVAQFLKESYQPQQTYSGAFARLLTRVMQGRGLILIDPMDRELHRCTLGLFRRALEEHARLKDDLAARSKALTGAGYHAQVKVGESSTLLFLDVDRKRLPLRVRNAAFVAGNSSFSKQQVLDLLERSPERVTGNALLRPLVQDSLLPTAACVAGPAEIAYYAQCEVLYRRLLGRMPVVLPRAAFTLVEPNVARLLKRYGVSLRQAFVSRAQLRRKLQAQALPKALAKHFAGGEKAIRSALKKLRAPVTRLDRTLAGALDTAERKMLYQFLKLRDKAGRSADSRSKLLAEHERILGEALYPEGGLQERTHSLLPYVARHGLGLLDELESRSALLAEHEALFV